MTEDKDDFPVVEEEQGWKTEYQLEQEEKRRLNKLRAGILTIKVIGIVSILAVPWLTYSFSASRARYISDNCGNPEWVDARWINSNWFCK